MAEPLRVGLAGLGNRRFGRPGHASRARATRLPMQRPAARSTVVAYCQQGTTPKDSSLDLSTDFARSPIQSRSRARDGGIDVFRGAHGRQTAIPPRAAGRGSACVAAAAWSPSKQGALLARHGVFRSPGSPKQRTPRSASRPRSPGGIPRRETLRGRPWWQPHQARLRHLQRHPATTSSRGCRSEQLSVRRMFEGGASDSAMPRPIPRLTVGGFDNRPQACDPDKSRLRHRSRRRVHSRRRDRIDRPCRPARCRRAPATRVKLLGVAQRNRRRHRTARASDDGSGRGHPDRRGRRRDQTPSRSTTADMLGLTLIGPGAGGSANVVCGRWPTSWILACGRRSPLVRRRLRPR